MLDNNLREFLENHQYKMIGEEPSFDELVKSCLGEIKANKLKININEINLDEIDIEEELLSVEAMIKKAEGKIANEINITDDKIFNYYKVVRDSITKIFRKEKNYVKAIQKSEYLMNAMKKIGHLNQYHIYFVEHMCCKCYVNLKQYCKAEQFGLRALKNAHFKDRIKILGTLSRVYRHTDINKSIKYIDMCIEFYESDIYVKNDKERNIALAKNNKACYTKDIDLALESLQYHKTLLKRGELAQYDVDEAYDTLIDAYIYNKESYRALEVLHNIDDSKLYKENLNKLKSEKQLMIVNN